MYKRLPKADLRLVNKYNKMKVLNVIREYGPISRAKVAEKANLSAPTVTRLVHELLKEKLIIDRGVGSPQNGVGRPPLILEFDGHNNFVIGVDLGTTNILGVLANLNAEVITEIKIPTYVQLDFKKIMERVRQVILDLIESSRIDKSRIQGIGMGVAGLIDREKEIVRFSPDFGWQDVSIRDELQDHIPYPIIFDNVTRVMAMGELCYGAGMEYRNFICINIGYGIGAGIVIDKKLFFGNKGMSGEFGHITLIKDGGPQCDCGNTGCLEALASGRGIALAARNRIKNGEKSILTDLVRGELQDITTELVAKAAKEGDPLARDVFLTAAEYIGIGVSALINLFNPQAIIIGGGVAQAGELLFEPVREVVRQRALSQAAEDVEIRPAHFGIRATVMGAVALVLHELLKPSFAMESVISSVS
ncbi:ROK family transcriptional regulator [Candidatus Sumerlaeota bacterium]|nr:ROK family transcriptional regulator [Candidatus Sumerlaeota bacterium]